MDRYQIRINEIIDEYFQKKEKDNFVNNEKSDEKFLPEYSDLHKELGLDNKYVIINREEWEKIRELFANLPPLE